MSMVYCHTHHRHRDTDYHTDCFECVDDVGILQDRVDFQKLLIKDMEKSDSRYYTNGKMTKDTVKLLMLEVELEQAEANLEKC